VLSFLYPFFLLVLIQIVFFVQILGLPAAPGSVSLLSAFSAFSDAQLCALLEDKFGNYVLQRASSLKQPNRTLLLVRLAPLVDRIRAEPATQLRQKIVAQFTQLFKTE
jgi:ABC-type dipeptide/oligopeptide/nickel transport system permease component